MDVMGKIARKLERLQRIAPKGPTRFGQFYAVIADTRRAFKKITLYTFFRSDDGDVMLRNHIFERKWREPKTPQEWSEWFAKLVPLDELNPTRDLLPRLTMIHKRAIIPGLIKKTGILSWRVERILGWIGSGTGRSRKKRKSGTSRKAKRRAVLKPKHTKMGQRRHTSK